MSKLSVIGGALLALAADDGVLGSVEAPTSLTRSDAGIHAIARLDA